MTGRWRVRSANRPTRRETGAPPKGADEVSPRSGASVVFVSDGDSFAPRRERFLCLRRPHFFQQRKKWGKERRQKLRFCTSSARYTALVCKAAPPRNRHFLTRCRSPDCASTAFRCRCLLLRQKLFVLPCRRLLYPVPNGHTYLCRLAAAKARFDNRHSTSAPTPTLTAVSGSGASGTSDPPNRQQRPPPSQFREISTANFA